MPEIFTEINWIDLIFIILFIGMVYKGTKTGVSGQLLSLAGWFLAIFASIEYYSFLSEAIFGFLLQRWAKPVSFVLISAIIFTTVKILERVFNIIRSEDAASLEKVGGVFIAAVRASILFGLIGILLLLTPFDYVRLSAAEGSRTCMFFVNMDVRIYIWIKEAVGLTPPPEVEVDEDREIKERDRIVKRFLTSPVVESPYEYMSKGER